MKSPSNRSDRSAGKKTIAIDEAMYKQIREEITQHVEASLTEKIAQGLSLHLDTVAGTVRQGAKGKKKQEKK